jgi:hypothetical protein
VSSAAAGAGAEEARVRVSWAAVEEEEAVTLTPAWVEVVEVLVMESSMAATAKRLSCLEVDDEDDDFTVVVVLLPGTGVT